MPYQKQDWADNTANRPLSADRMNHMEDGIEAASRFIVIEANGTVPPDTPIGTIVVKKDS